jgi:hypothetical protein
MGLAGRRDVEERLAWKYSEAPYLAAYRRVLEGKAARQGSGLVAVG